jgi:peptide/nickel transport system permease protein
MSAPSPESAALPIAPVALDRPQGQWTRLGPVFYVSAGWLLLVASSAVLAPVLHLADPTFQELSNQGALPGGDHLLGTDSLGRDMASRLVHGAQISLTVGVLSTAVAMVIGGFLGLMAGYFRGPVEGLIGVGVDALLAFPALVLALAVVTYWGHDIKNLVIVIGGLTIPAFARVSRASTLAFSQREFVLAARAMGAGHFRILRVDILPNVIGPMLAFALLAVAVAMIAEGTLAFLGLSVPPPAASWGAMIAEGRANLDTTPWVTLIPAAVFFATIFALNTVADRLRGLAAVRSSQA